MAIKSVAQLEGLIATNSVAFTKLKLILIQCQLSLKKEKKSFYYV